MTDAEFLDSIGKRIKSIRVQNQMSQTELAIKCNFEKATMSRIESGKVNITILTLKKISNALEVDVYKIIKI